MSIEQNFDKDLKSIMGVAAADSERTLSCFDCNICLDFANEPVVTLCGHLYCWPCIYKWFCYQSTGPVSINGFVTKVLPLLRSIRSGQFARPKFPTPPVVPLYGRGETISETTPKGNTPHRGISIPQRPPALGTQTLITTPTDQTQRLPYQNLQHSPVADYSDNEEDSESSPAHTQGSTLIPYYPAIQMLGDMAYTIVFRNSLSLYTYPNSYPNSNPRLRRQHMQAAKSSSRVSLFLFCGILVCLLLF